FQSRLPGKNRDPRLKFTNFKLYLVFFRETYIGRIGDYDIEGRLDSGEKVGLVKSNPRLQVQASSVCARKLECLCRNIRCVNLDLRQFLRQGQCDAARTCAHID